MCDIQDFFLSFISILSTLGIALGVATLIIVLSVMNGFQKEVRDKMLSVLSHIEVFPQSSSKNVSRDIMEGLKQRTENESERSPKNRTMQSLLLPSGLSAQALIYGICITLFLLVLLNLA